MAFLLRAGGRLVNAVQKLAERRELVRLLPANHSDATRFVLVGVNGYEGRLRRLVPLPLGGQFIEQRRPLLRELFRFLDLDVELLDIGHLFLGPCHLLLGEVAVFLFGLRVDGGDVVQRRLPFFAQGLKSACHFLSSVPAPRRRA